MNINAHNLNFKELNQKIREATDGISVNNCCGQRFIASGMNGKKITINGTPGNALGCYLNGAEITVNGNAQDATGDTMNAGRITIHGSAGDALGYAMRGGNILVKGNSGYRTGIHMKEYKEQRPVIVVGGRAGSFLGEYMAGGLIIVLGLSDRNRLPFDAFAGTGMHGGSIFVRTEIVPGNLPAQVLVSKAQAVDLEEIRPFLASYAAAFGADAEELLKDTYYTLKPNAKNPYHQMYTRN
ncbi:MAG: glutamate synthase [Oscillospiraceae bacterium]|jgi:glutamate synthase domain-containing protein 3|nr:glutamate synthase [Oscillospiraceae bacterium]